MKAALLAVAPLLSAAARRKALEEAAAYCDTMEAGHRARATELEAANIEAATAQDRIANTWGVCAAAIRALGRPA